MAPRLLTALTLAVALLASPSGAAPPAPLPGTVRHVSVTGTNVVTFPEYDESVSRFAIRPGGNTGAVTLTASSTDEAGRIWLDGRPVPNGEAVALNGLSSGDEVSVIIEDSAGRLTQSFIYLPADFPVLDVTVNEPDRHPGFVTLGMNSFLSAGYEAVVDEHGVPVHVRGRLGHDLKASDADPSHYSVARRADAGGWEIVELDEQFEPVRSFQLAGALAGSTDFHDAELLPGGGALLMGYDSASREGVSYVDAIIQVVDANGVPTFTWNSRDHVDPSEAYVDGGQGDYAHINSLQMQDDGDVVASFRNLSQVMRIATVAHDGHQPGDVVWRFGGERNDFDIAGDDDHGPCAQHVARIEDNGNLVLFDNGSRQEPGDSGFPLQTADMCPTATPGVRAARPESRVSEYALDEEAMTATLVRDYRSPGRYAAFAGSQQYLGNGNTLIGWSQATDEEPPITVQPIATEVTATGEEVWSIQSEGWGTYRAASVAAPDRIAPEIEVAGLTEGQWVDEGDEVVVDYGCTDRGGSNLMTCSAGSTASGGAIDTSRPGRRSLTVRAVDGAGNAGSRTVGYRVRAAHQPDLMLRRPGAPWVGGDRYPSATGQALVFTLGARGGARTAQLSVGNDGFRHDRVLVRGTAGNAGWSARYLVGRRDVTSQVVAGRLRTPLLAPGQQFRLRVVLRRTAPPAATGRRVFRLVSTSLGNGTRVDRASVTVRTPRR